MNMIKVEWELTPNQRLELMNALQHYKIHLRKVEPAISELITGVTEVIAEEVSTVSSLIDLVSKLKCGDPHCSYCGDGDHYTEWDE